MSIRNLFLAAFCMLTLSGCLLVRDFGSAWEKATPDACLSPIAAALHFEQFQRNLNEGEINTLARGISLDGKNFLLLKNQAGDAGGNMYFFKVESGIFYRYRLNPARRAQFEEAFPDAPVSIRRDTVTLPNLEGKAREVLMAVASQTDYWEVADSSMYNPLRDPQCRFEDRDLSTLDD